jgi:hypothetical protein
MKETGGTGFQPVQNTGENTSATRVNHFIDGMTENTAARLLYENFSKMWSRRPRLLFKGTAGGGCSTFFILGGGHKAAMIV